MYSGRLNQFPVRLPRDGGERVIGAIQNQLGPQCANHVV